MKSKDNYMWSCTSEKCVGGSVAKGKRGKKRQKVDNADLSQPSDYAAEVFYQFFLKVIK